MVFINYTCTCVNIDGFIIIDLYVNIDGFYKLYLCKHRWFYNHRPSNNYIDGFYKLYLCKHWWFLYTSTCVNIDGFINYTCVNIDGFYNHRPV